MKLIKTGILLFAILWIVIGLIYPLFITAIAKLVFPWQADGSLIEDENGKIIGSALIGQPFSDLSYFWPRPSATSEFPYNALYSGGSNLGPTNDELIKQISERKKLLLKSGINDAIPSDLVMASASGLDPHISLEAALAQVPHVAKERGLEQESVQKLVFDNLENPWLGLIGNPRVNVLVLNLALDNMEAKNGR
jgi:potassium-transporting ATPase KdpC subunit